MKRLRIGLLAMAMLALTSLSVFAQTALNSTTFSAAVTAADTAVSLTSATNVLVGDLLVANREAMRVTSLVSTRAQVVRGAGGTTVNAHPSLSVVYTGVPARFYSSVPRASTCSRTAERFLPRIVFPSGDIWDCFAGTTAWVHLNDPAAVTVPCHANLFTDQVDYTCFTADRGYVITRITYVSRTVEAAGTLTVIPRRQQGTEAPASGDALATALSGVTVVAQTVTPFVLTATQSLLILAAGDRLGIDFTDDVAGELAGTLVTFTLVPR